MSISSVLSLALCLGLTIWLAEVKGSGNEICTRRDGKTGLCVHYRECSKILNLFMRTQRSQEELTYLRSSRCPVHKRGFVCCEDEKISPGVETLLDQNCGRFGPTFLTIGAREIPIMSRPWMALLKFKTKDRGEQFLCGGTLITNRFIMTAAHCLMNPERELISVRLGEHRISTTVDCGINSRYQVYCAPPVEDFGFESVFVHEQWIVKGNNDIALIKLSGVVEYKIHIQPICLPLNRTLQQRGEELMNFRVTGWGQNEQAQFSDVLSEVFIPKRNRSVCATAYGEELTESQYCAGGPGKGAGFGDSGGPLVYFSEYKDSDRFVQFGIVSYGAPECGTRVPGIYTNVGSLIPWIADKIGNN